MNAPIAAYYYDPKKGRIIIVLHYEQWAARNLLAKGFFSMTHLFTREMTPDEVEAMRECTRLHFYAYFCWREFFADEEEMAVPAQAVKRLKKFAAAHPLRDDTKSEDAPNAK